MVQFQRVHYPLDSLADANEFWKLHRLPHPKVWVRRLKQILDHRNYPYRDSASKTRLRQLIMRCYQGLLSYERLDSKELTKFITDRKMTISADAKKDDLILTLERADQTATFSRFFQLPPELRNAIYNIHFESFDAVCPLPVPPPISKASRQLRQESHELFYYNCVTRFRFRNVYPDWSRRRFTYPHRGANEPHYADLETEIMFSKMPEHMLGSIRRFDLVGVVYGTMLPFRERDFQVVKWEVDLTARDSRNLFSCAEKPTQGPIFAQAYYDAAVEKLERRLKVLLEEIAGRQGNKKLQRADLESFKSMFIVTDDELQD